MRGMKNLPIYLLLTVGGVIFAYPFIWMLFATFKPEMDITGIGLWAPNMSLDNYRTVLTKIPIGRALLNSMFVSLCVTTCVLFFGSIVGYALARLNFLGRELIFSVIP